MLTMLLFVHAWVEDNKPAESSLLLPGGGLVHERFQPVEIAANGPGSWSEACLAIIIDESFQVLLGGSSAAWPRRNS
jgi:hypothetical protein